MRWIREANLTGRVDNALAGVAQQIGGNVESQMFDQVRVAQVALVQATLQRAYTEAGKVGCQFDARMAFGQIGAQRRPE